VEDTAQAFGASFKKKKLGTIAEAGAFSFFPSKNLGACGDGGLIATNSKSIKDTALLLRQHGQCQKKGAVHLGYTSRLDSIQAAMLLTKLKHIDRFNRLRRAVASFYTKALRDCSEIYPPQEIKGSAHIYHLYTMRVSARVRDKLIRYLNKKGIGARAYYPVPLYGMRAFRGAKKRSQFKNTKRAVAESVSLPMHPFLTKTELTYVAKAVKTFFNKR